MPSVDTAEAEGDAVKFVSPLGGRDMWDGSVLLPNTLRLADDVVLPSSLVATQV